MLLQVFKSVTGLEIHQTSWKLESTLSRISKGSTKYPKCRIVNLEICVLWRMHAISDDQATKNERETDGHNKSFVSLSTKEPHLACSLSVTVPAAVVRTVAVVAVMVVVAMAVKGTIGSNLRAGNRNRGLAARASHTPQVLPGLLSFVLGPRNTYTWDSWQAGDRRAPGSSTRTSLFSSANRRIECRRRRAIPNDYPSCRSLQSRDRRWSNIGPFRLLSLFKYFRSSWRTASSLSAWPVCQSHTYFYITLYHFK